MSAKKAQIHSSWLIVSSLVAIVFGGGGYALFHFLQPSVDVTDVVEAPVVEAFYATGTVSPEREYSIRATTSGIVRMKVDKGSVAKKGEVLAVVENSDLQFAVDQANAELQRKQLLADAQTSPILGELQAKLKSSTEMLEIANDDQKRMESLRSQGGTSQSDLDVSMNRVKTQWSDVESLKSQIKARQIDLDRDVTVAQAAMKSAQWNLDQATITSPIDGTVLDWPVSSGTRVAVNDHILQMADVTPAHLVMRAQVDEEDKNKLRPPTPGQPPQVVKMTLYAYPNEILTATLDKIYDKADPSRRTYEVDVKFDHPDARLAAGMTGELNFIVAAHDQAIVVPTQAVQGGGVMVVKNGRLEKRDVVLGLRSVDRTEIQSGLAIGERIVISPILDLEAGELVREHFIDPVIAGNINRPKESDGSFHGFN